jgi:acyl-coenzyme A synthetase/AMP-(fatty) acid ligase
MTGLATPLLAHASPTSVVAYRAGLPIDARRFLDDATDLADRLPPGRHVLNVCTDRYRFAVGLAACLMTGRVSLLPSTRTAETIRALAEFAPDAFCLTDGQDCDIALPQFSFPPPATGRLTDSRAWKIPQIPTAQCAAIVFTSGSTGTPLPYGKTWGKLSRCVQDGAPRLGLSDGRHHTLIGTVPPQHMYGFESTVLLAMLSGNAFAAEQPFYPADICACLAAVPRPRVLVTTPVHLRALLIANLDLPATDLVVSATAPLAQDTAMRVSTQFRAPLLEIYGSTETGQIATRDTVASPKWRLWPDVRLLVRGDEVLAMGGHVEQPTPMCDVIEIVSQQEFLLHGRRSDLVNVAGKRSSFGYLNAQLNAIPGVVDGAFFLRDADCGEANSGDADRGGTGVARLAALVVAPGLSAPHLIGLLRERIDAVFLPRPLLLVDRLPRNATGKLPKAALEALAERRLRAGGAGGLRAPLKIDPDHPAFAGHFPGFPVLPGAVLLDEALHAIGRGRGLDLVQWRVASAKFLRFVRPGELLVLEHSAVDDGGIRFTIRAADLTVVSGVLSHGG